MMIVFDVFCIILMANTKVLFAEMSFTGNLQNGSYVMLNCYTNFELRYNLAEFTFGNKTEKEHLSVHYYPSMNKCICEEHYKCICRKRNFTIWLPMPTQETTYACHLRVQKGDINKTLKFDGKDTTDHTILINISRTTPPSRINEELTTTGQFTISKTGIILYSLLLGLIVIIVVSFCIFYFCGKKKRNRDDRRNGPRINRSEYEITEGVDHELTDLNTSHV